MKSPYRLLKSLETMKFLKVIEIPIQQCSNKTYEIQLQKNGEEYAKQFDMQWRNYNYDGFKLHNSVNSKNLNIPCNPFSQKRFNLFYSNAFIEYMKNLQTRNTFMNFPVVIKTKQILKNIQDNPNSKATIFDLGEKETTLLISDFIVYPVNGLETFYNIQRARKIWWMRNSANPSRYFLEPYLDEESEKINCSFQSISINSRFGFGNVLMEHITLAPLHELANTKGFVILDPQTHRTIHPTVIRSVINLELAASALLLDAFDHNRNNILLLNRKLAPYQCAISCLYDEKLDDELVDLGAHLSSVLRRAGIRLYDEFNVFVQSVASQNQQYEIADNIGIPYLLKIEMLTLKTGLLGLRSRDTSLVETIHLSDIPNYLLNIFNN